METKRNGKCINFGNCAKADRKEIIDLDFTEDFVCPECNGDLLEEPTKGGGAGGNKNMLIIIIVAAVVLLGGGAAAWYFFFNDEGQPPVKPDKEIVKDTTVTQPKDTITPSATEPERPKTEESKTTTTQNPKSVVNSGTIAVAGGNYTGTLKAGKPHGMGTLKYNAHTLISSRDAKKRYAESGEYITGEFYEGDLVQGQLFDKNNEPKEKINIGRPR